MNTADQIASFLREEERSILTRIARQQQFMLEVRRDADQLDRLNALLFASLARARSYDPGQHLCPRCLIYNGKAVDLVVAADHYRCAEDCGLVIGLDQAIAPPTDRATSDPAPAAHHDSFLPAEPRSARRGATSMSG